MLEEKEQDLNEAVAESAAAETEVKEDALKISKLHHKRKSWKKPLKNLQKKSPKTYLKK